LLNSLFHSYRRKASALSIGLLAVCLLTFAPDIRAQGPSVPSVQAPGSVKKEEASIQTKAERGEAPLARLYDFLKVDSAKVHRLPALAPSRTERRSEKKVRIGEVRPFERPLKSLSDSTLYNVADGEVRVMGLVSEGALSTRVHFTRMALPKGARLFVYSASNPDDFQGPYTDRGPSGNGDFWTPSVEGDEVVVEYFAPKSAVSASSGEAFTISEVGHIFTDPFLKAAAGSCNLEVTSDWANIAKSVGHLQFVDGGSVAVCTGTLLNNQAQDFTPYLLTANHCIDNQQSAQSLVVYWLYNTGNTPPAGTPQTNGATLLATGTSSDYTLLRLTGTLPGGLIFSGWDATATPVGTSITGIHHPQGSHKRISFGTTITSCVGGLPGPCQNFTPVRWNQGTTEGGSSGSGLWKGTPADARLVGTLTGGEALCSNLNGIDYYGSFSVTYPNISSFLTGTGPTAPANNNFINAQTITGCSGTVNGTNILATKEPGEPNHEPGGNPGGASVWYQWQAPSTGSVTINTTGSSYDTLLAVYTGNSVGGLTSIVKNDDIAAGNTASSVTFNATAGVVYRIAVDGYNGGSSAATGNIVLNWNETNCGVVTPATVQFNQASYSVSEGTGFINIVVTRTDTTGAATVKYATSDSTDANFSCNQVTGVASRKCDYHIANGKLRFAAGEATKQFTLSLINDVYVEGSETLTLTLSSPTGAALGTNSSVPMTITDNDTAGAPNPIDTTSFYVRQLYVDLLSREPDPSGLSGWTTRIDQCGQPGQPPPPCDRVTVGGDGFLRSGEFFDRQFFVLRLYRTGLGRILRYDEVGDLAFVSGFLTETDLELNKQDLVAEIMSRTEFGTRYNGLDNTQFVDTLLQTAAVAVPADVRLGWIAALNNSSLTRAQVYRQISERPEVSNAYAREAQVVSAYYGFFTRNPDGAYLNFLQRLNSGEITLGDLANAFINAAEYRQRFGQ
jgi:Calx-beta domain